MRPARLERAISSTRRPAIYDVEGLALPVGCRLLLRSGPVPGGRGTI